MYCLPNFIISLILNNFDSFLADALHFTFVCAKSLVVLSFDLSYSSSIFISSKSSPFYSFYEFINFNFFLQVHMPKHFLTILRSPLWIIFGDVSSGLWSVKVLMMYPNYFKNMSFTNFIVFLPPTLIKSVPLLSDLILFWWSVELDTITIDSLRLVKITSNSLFYSTFCSSFLISWLIIRKLILKKYYANNMDIT